MITTMRRLRPVKRLKLTTPMNITEELRSGCCRQQHVTLLRHSCFSIAAVLRARLIMCTLTEPEVLNRIAAMLSPMYNRSSSTFTYIVEGHVVCRHAFTIYWGLSVYKLDVARRMTMSNMLVTTHGRNGQQYPTYARAWLHRWMARFFHSVCDTHQSGSNRLCLTRASEYVSTLVVVLPHSPICTSLLLSFVSLSTCLFALIVLRQVVSSAGDQLATGNVIYHA
jgi:hypothetical protein